MEYTEEQIREKIRSNVNRSEINRALFHQNRIRFHVTERVTEECTQPLLDFFAFVDNILPHDKAKTFKTLFRYPLCTNKVTAACFDKLSRIFDGRNVVFSYRFASPDIAQDWADYRKDGLGEPSVWSTKGWEFFKTEINSVLVVDMPEEQEPGDRYPRPYFYWLPVADVMAYEANPDDGVMQWLAYRQEGKRIAVIDGASYRMFRERDGNIGELLWENRHDLGYCPARFFWDESISIDHPDVKKSPLTKELEALDWLLFFSISKRNLDLFGSYPILSGYEQECDYSNSENGDYCDGGFLRDRQGHYLFDASGTLLPCPKCGSKRIVGAGSFIEIPVPKDGDADLRNPVQMLEVDRGSLDYNVDEEKRLRTDIITDVVGTNEEITTRDALNEQQVKANFESQTTVLRRIKLGFELAQKFVDDTVCRLRYGEAFLSSAIDYGTEFYLYDADELRERYASAKANGATESELDALQERIIDTEYRNDPLRRNRMKQLAEIEEYRHLSRAEVSALHDKGLIDAEDLLVKLDFPGFISRFETENGDITEFGSAIDHGKKITIIKEKLKEYARERLSKKRPAAPDGGAV